MASGGLVVQFQENYKVGTILKGTGNIATTIFNEEVDSSKVTDKSLVRDGNAQDQGKGLPISEGSLEVTLMTSLVDRYEATCAEASAEVSGWGATGSAKGAYANKAGLNGNNVSLVISSHAVVETNVATNLDDLTLQKEIGMIINEHGIDYLEREFGMYIIDSIDYAVGYTACYHFECESSEQNQEVSASLSVYYNGLVAKGGASTEAKSSITQASSKSNTTFFSSEIGTSPKESAPPVDPQKVIQAARDAMTNDKVGAAFRCRLRRLRDFVCVKEAFSKSCPTPALMLNALGNDYARVYNFVPFMMDRLRSVSANEKYETVYATMERFRDDYSPSSSTIKQTSTPGKTYVDMINKFEEIVKELKKAGVALPYISGDDASGPPVLKAGTFYHLTNAGALQTAYLIQLIECPVEGYFCIYRHDIRAYLDSYSAYWHGPGIPEGYGPTNNWLWWQLLPVGNHFYIRGWRADTDFNRLQAPLFFTGDVTQSAVGFPSEDSEGLLNFMWTFQAIAEESS